MRTLICALVAILLLARTVSAQMDIERLAVWPNAPVVGEPCHAVVSLYNAGDTSITERVVFHLNDAEYAMQTVPIPPRKRLSIRQELRIIMDGDYTVTVGGVSYPFTVLSADSTMEERRELARRWPRRIIYNNDGGDALYHRDVHTYLDVSTTGLIGSHVDSIWYSTVGGFTFWHNTKAGQFIDRGVAHALQHEFGKDALEMQIDFGREHGIEVMWSMRMNDTHDRVDQWSWMMPQFKRDHPQFLVGSPDKSYSYGGKNWSGLNYEHAEVRQLVYEVIEDVARRYDVDGIELDFFRGEPYFPAQLDGFPVGQRECDLVTDLIRRLYNLTVEVSEKRGRPLLLGVRVPDSMAYGKAIGVDLEQWLEEGLVDIVIASGDRRFEPWENSRRLVHGYARPVYACLPGDYLRQERDGWEDVWRGHAREAWRAGMNGIYTFNFLRHRSPLFRQMGSQELLETLDCDYEFIAGAYWGWLNDERAYIHAVAVNPPSGPFAEHLTIDLTFIPEEGHTIHFTLDGSEPGPSSAVYTEPIGIDDSAILRTRSISPDGTWTPVVTERYNRVAARYAPADDALPLDFFGTPQHHEMSLELVLPELPAGARTYLHLTMMDVDAPEESLFFINGHGPIAPPLGIISGSMTLTDTLEVPADYFVVGTNEIRFRFDNLNEGTSGFIVYDCQVLVE